MTYDLPCMSYMAMYIISVHIVNSNSRSSVGANHWRLNIEDGKIQLETDTLAGTNDGPGGDRMLSILTNKKVENGQWLVDGDTDCVTSCRDREKMESVNDGTKTDIPEKSRSEKNDSNKYVKKVLSCGKATNYTQYDHLRGIAARSEHPHIPEPEVAIMFRKKSAKSSEVDMTELEIKLRKIKKQNPKSSNTYSQIGNFWRIKGNTQLSIECFRKALNLSPNNPEILLYLARILFNLQYLDDAIFLTRRSLAMQSNDDNSWHQHFTLGEILKAYGHYEEASLHFQQALKLNPGFQRAEAHLRDMEGCPSPSVTQYTLFIILFLVMGVVFGVITSMEASYEEGVDGKPQRHFNRAMAMRSMKLGINPRLIRMRKMNSL